MVEEGKVPPLSTSRMVKLLKLNERLELDRQEVSTLISSCLSVGTVSLTKLCPSPWYDAARTPPLPSLHLSLPSPAFFHPMSQTLADHRGKRILGLQQGRGYSGYIACGRKGS